MIACTIANSAWLAGCLPDHLRFRRSVRRVEQEQQQVLHRILANNARADFGRRHHFGRIRTVRDFQRQVPLSEYEDYRPSIDRIANGANAVLTTEPVQLFEPTSGSSAASKWIPYTASLQREFQRGIRAWVADLFLNFPSLMHGGAYWSVSPAAPKQRKTAGGIPIGFAADSAYVGGWQQRLVESVMAVPVSVRRIEDMDRFWSMTVSMLLRRRDLRMISVWNPSFLTLLLDRLSESEAVWHAITPAERHARLWPHLRLISCWGDANAQCGVRRIEELFPQATIQRKGLIATEGFISLPLHGYDGAALAVRSHFLEFLPVHADGPSDQTTPLLAHELERGRSYEVVLTTGGGLYRYRLHDVIEVTGHIAQCPLVRFRGRSGYVSDWAGEKLNEAHVARVLEKVFAAHGIAPAFAMLACDTEQPAGYVLYIETAAPDGELLQAAERIEAALRENFHYCYARDLGQLAALRVFRTERAEASYLAVCMEAGQRAGDIKPLSLDRRDGWSARFRGHFLTPAAARPAR